MADVTYQVIKQEHDNTFRSDGTTGGMWTVHLQHADGTKGTVTLPDEEYTAGNVHALAQQQANVVKTVSELPASVANAV